RETHVPRVALSTSAHISQAKPIRPGTLSETNKDALLSSGARLVWPFGATRIPFKRPGSADCTPSWKFPFPSAAIPRGARKGADIAACPADQPSSKGRNRAQGIERTRMRSEERRVGKEWRSRVVGEHYKQKEGRR